MNAKTRIRFQFRVPAHGRHVWRSVTIDRVGAMDDNLDASLIELFRRYPGVRVHGVR